VLHDVLAVLYFFLPAYAADMSPVLIGNAFPALATPIDGGRTFRGRRIFGDHKTWRGLLAGVVAGALVFLGQRVLWDAGFLQDLALIDYGRWTVVPGLLMGLGALVGDAVKSFFKRQVGIAPGASWLVFDQLDFFAGAYLFVAPIEAAPLLPTLACLPIVFAGTIAFTAAGWGLGLKEAWI
jgi:CDP-2,3-bis-(O-geranylgeranyl)-sn-glycerol synthase